MQLAGEYRCTPGICDDVSVTTDDSSSRTWLTLSETADLLGVSRGRVSQLIRDRALLSMRIDREPRIPADFIKNGEPVAGLRGTLILLFDAGLADDEVMNWVLTHDETLGAAPVDALRQGRKTEVRHSVQLLAI